MRRPQLRSTFARAVVPVLVGIGFFVVVGLLLWGVAALTSRNRDDTTANLAPAFQEMGNAQWVADHIVDGGPIILQDLIGSDRNIVLDHTGADPGQGWAIYLALPAGSRSTLRIPRTEMPPARSSRCGALASSPTAMAARSRRKTWPCPRSGYDRSSTTTAR